MGSWGAGILENDAALDFLDKLKKSRKTKRLKIIADTIERYNSFHERVLSGTNVSVLSESDIADLWKSRDQTLAYYTSIGEPPPIEYFPQLESVESYAKFVEELSVPRFEDGFEEASQILVGAFLLRSALAGLTHNKSVLAHVPRVELVQLAKRMAAGILLILDNPLLPEAWGPEAYAVLVANVKEIASGLESECERWRRKAVS